jgi:quinol monooxygenase YgiN
MPEPTSEQPVQVLLPGRRSMLVRLNCQAGMRPSLLEVLNTYTDGLAEEPGTEVFVVSLDPDAENTVWLFEVFKDEQAQIAHQSAAGFAVLMNAIPPLLDGPPAVLRMEPLRMAMQEGLLTEDWSF